MQNHCKRPTPATTGDVYTRWGCGRVAPPTGHEAAGQEAQRLQGEAEARSGQTQETVRADHPRQRTLEDFVNI